MKQLFILLATVSFAFQVNAQIFKAKDNSTEISFFSSSPLEDITAVNKGAVIVMNSANGDIQIRITNTNFKFKNSLMEEHFNENYMESQKFPNSIFKGKVNEKVNYEVDGENKVTISGKLEIHGVTKDVTLDGVIQVKGKELSISSKFKVKVADYNIKVPSLYVKNIAEVVDVSLSSVLEPFQKK
ncbi:MAG: YceI family protein [Sphingobacteriaceae bacterium]|nr:YceI family protein [Sphingobacteriaceae bacterium]